MSWLDRLLAGRRKIWSREALLALFADYVGEQRVADIAHQMAPIGDQTIVVPPKILCILFSSRSGSTYAGKLLSNAPWFADVNESFHALQLNAIRDRFDLATGREAVQWMVDNRGTDQAFGYKAGFSVLIGAAVSGFLSETLAATQFIRLERRDRVAQAVSLLKAEVSGRLHSIDPEGAAVSADDYDADKIAFNVAHIARNERWFAAILDRLGKDAPIFAYEDISANPAAFIAEVGTLLSLPETMDIEPGTGLKIMRDAISESWSIRFRAEHPEIT